MSQMDIMFAIISTFVLRCSIFAANSEIPVRAKDAAYNSPARAQDKANKAYHRLRSCHRVLSGESGEFFSPDFLCSNPPLWCNWTVLAPPGRRIRLQLQDYTADESCHSKRDQIHLDELPGSGKHRTLTHCWRTAVYTSDSSTLYVVLLVDGSLEPTYRGFYARYHTFGLPNTTTPAPPPPPFPPPSPTRATNAIRGREAEEDEVREKEKRAMEKAQTDADPTLRSTTDSPSPKESSITKSPLTEQPFRTSPAQPVSLDTVSTQARVSDTQEGEAEGSVVTKVPPPKPKMDSKDTLKDVKGTSDDLGVTDSPAKGDPSNEVLAHTDRAGGLGSVDPPDQEPVEKRPPNVTSPTPPIAGSLPEIWSPAPPPEFQELDEDEEGSRSTRKPREGWDEDTGPGRPALDDPDRLDPPWGSVERQGMEFARGGRSNRPPENPPLLEDSLRERADLVRHIKNSSAIASLPGENLFEVSVEVRLTPGVNENWDHLVRLVMSSVQSMIQDELRAHIVPKTISSIRIKRLSAGVLFIFWLHFGDGLEGLQVHRFLRMALPQLQSRTVDTRGRTDPATIASVSSEDINECGTQLVLCDVNAECLNRFGSYACRCSPGFEDRSRLGSGGTVCVAGTGPAQSEPPPASSSTLLNSLCGLCFLLGLFVVLLLGVLGALYRRQHRGAFAVPCHARQNGSGGSGASELPPPPPPVRRPKDGWGGPKDGCPSADLPLLKFAPLPPPADTPQYGEREEGDKL